MRIPWTATETLSKCGEVPWTGQDSGFIWEEDNGIIMCDPNCTVIDFQTEHKLTEEEIKSLEYAEGIVEDRVFYVAAARIEGKYYLAD